MAGAFEVLWVLALELAVLSVRVPGNLLHWVSLDGWALAIATGTMKLPLRYRHDEGYGFVPLLGEGVHQIDRGDVFVYREESNRASAVGIIRPFSWNLSEEDARDLEAALRDAVLYARAKPSTLDPLEAAGLSLSGGTESLAEVRRRVFEVLRGVGVSAEEVASLTDKPTRLAVSLLAVRLELETDQRRQAEEERTRIRRRVLELAEEALSAEKVARLAEAREASTAALAMLGDEVRDSAQRREQWSAGCAGIMGELRTLADEVSDKVLAGPRTAALLRESARRLEALSELIERNGGAS